MTKSYLSELTATKASEPTHAQIILIGAAQGYECFPSEGGHAEFAPHNILQAEMLEYLTAKIGGRVSVERVVSGSGIPNVSTVP